MYKRQGQKCTAIRRALVPAAQIDAVQEAITARLTKVVVGDPAVEGVTMGALASLRQLQDVRAKARLLATEARLVSGTIDAVEACGVAAGQGAFIAPLLFRADDPWQASAVHDIEAFGPVATLMPYSDVEDAIALANRGKGSLALSVFTHDPALARAFVLGAAAYHGRIVLIDRDCARESTGHGSPLPMLIHGGPGRAGGGEEMGGIRGVKHYMQRSALQGSPRTLSAITGTWLPGAPQTQGAVSYTHLDVYKRQLYTMSSKGRRELPDGHVLMDGDVEPIGKRGSFIGQHVYTSLPGAAVHINAFNFPVWGMLEKLGPVSYTHLDALALDQPVQRLGDAAPAAFEGGRLGVDHRHAVAGLCGDLGDAAAHDACADDGDLRIRCDAHGAGV